MKVSGAGQVSVAKFQVPGGRRRRGWVGKPNAGVYYDLCVAILEWAKREGIDLS